jgi:hypothetical protein
MLKLQDSFRQKSIWIKAARSLLPLLAGRGFTFVLHSAGKPVALHTLRGYRKGRSGSRQRAGFIDPDGMGLLVNPPWENSLRSGSNQLSPGPIHESISASNLAHGASVCKCLRLRVFAVPFFVTYVTKNRHWL